jgi:hypothetical protein
MNLSPLAGLLSPLGFSRAPAVADFSPADVAGLQLWLEADAITGLADGDPVATWADASGHGNDATQPTAPSQPAYRTAVLNGRPVLRFAGGQTLYSSAMRVQPYTVFVVVRETTNSVNQYIIDGLTINSGVMSFPGSSDPGKVYLYAGVLLSAPAVTTSWNLLTGTFAGVSSTIAVNGSVTSGNAGTGTADGVLIGGSAGALLVGDIAAVLLYDSALADANRMVVESYLMTKYGL